RPSRTSSIKSIFWFVGVTSSCVPILLIDLSSAKSVDQIGFNVVLVEPEIPPNTGNVGRLCLATQSTLHLVKPLGFSLEDRQLKRAGLDYWDEVDVRIWNSFAQCQQAQLHGARYFFLSTKAN